ncbi:tryptophan-rich sensory protein, partial [Halorubrum sp. AJ67]|uniref:tryptophan-rich sensory protein n=1 Tax=Halorubrum sp. AJ67 TaxID=1173487 RepID=UPI00064EE572
MATTATSRLPGRRDTLLIAAAAVGVNLIGALGVPFTTARSAWFASLELPAFYPPSWAFGVVWPILYALLG